MQLKVIIGSFFFIAILSCHRHFNKEKNNTEIVQTSPSVDIPKLPVFLKKMSAKDTNTTGVPLLFHYKKTPCFGYCPVYEFSLFANGIACYNGFNFVKQEGKTYGLLNEEIWNEIKVKSEQISFFSLKEKYPEEEKLQIADLPLSIITMNNLTQSHTVTDSHSAPKELKEFETYIELVINEFLDAHLR